MFFALPNTTALLVEAGVFSAETLAPLRTGCEELTPILVAMLTEEKLLNGNPCPLFRNLRRIPHRHTRDDRRQRRNVSLAPRRWRRVCTGRVNLRE
jgi:hypothetical protein